MHDFLFLNLIFNCGHPVGIKNKNCHHGHVKETLKTFLIQNKKRKRMLKN